MKIPWPKSGFMFLKSLILGKIGLQTIVTKEKIDNQPLCLTAVSICSSTSVIVLECSLYQLFFKKPLRGREGGRWKWREREERAAIQLHQRSPLGSLLPFWSLAPKVPRPPPSHLFKPISGHWSKASMASAAFHTLDYFQIPFWLLCTTTPPPNISLLSPFPLSTLFSGSQHTANQIKGSVHLAGTILGLHV